MKKYDHGIWEYWQLNGIWYARPKSMNFGYALNSHSKLSLLRQINKIVG